MFLNFLKKTIRIIVFSAVLIAVFFLFTQLLTPTWTTWSNDDTVKGFYNDPDNTVQVIYIGTSQVASGFSPVDLYDRFGICSFNLGTEQQPLLSSLYWLAEAKRKHPQSLKVCLLDLSYLFYQESDYKNLKFFNEKALAHMQLSEVKLGALRDLSKTYDDFDYTENLFPLLRYHSRWNELSRDDFKGITGEVNSLYTRGQQIFYSPASSTANANSILLPRWDLTIEEETLEEDAFAYSGLYDAQTRNALTRIINYCDKHGIALIFTKIPKGWSDLLHDSVVSLSREYNIPFIDMNDGNFFDEIGLFPPFDYVDYNHPNVRGARKITTYLGRYLKEHYDLEDVRGDPRYDFMKEQSDEYRNIREDSRVTSITDLSYYLRTIDKPRYTVFVTAAGDATQSMPDAIKQQMADLGFTGFSSLRMNQPYAAIRSEGTVLAEETSLARKSKVWIDGTLEKQHFYISDTYDLTMDKDGYILGTKDGANPTLLQGAGYFWVKSESAAAGGATSVVINNVEYSDNRHGLNFVVYDNITRMVVDSATFDLRYGNQRRSDLDPVEAYSERYEAARAKAEEERLAREAEAAENPDGEN